MSSRTLLSWIGNTDLRKTLPAAHRPDRAKARRRSAISKVPDVPVPSRPWPKLPRSCGPLADFLDARRQAGVKYEQIVLLFDTHTRDEEGRRRQDEVAAEQYARRIRAWFEGWLPPDAVACVFRPS